MDTTTLPAFDTLWDYDQPAVSEARFRELVPQAEAAGEAGYLAELLTQIARSQGLQRDFAGAHTTLDRTEALLPGAGDRARVRLLLERGRAWNSAGQPDTARPLFVAAWDLARAAGEDGLAVDAAHMVAIVAPPAEQMAWNERALALAESSLAPAAQRWRGSLYNNMGWTYHDQGRYAEALALFERARAWRETRADSTPHQVRIARWAVARALRSLGRTAEALAQQQALATGYPDLPPDGYVDEEIAECLLALEGSQAAQPAAARAYALLAADPWLREQEPDRLQRLKDMGQT
jgi:tetratricopeptide (TPR) repeat protein